MARIDTNSGNGCQSADSEVERLPQEIRDRIYTLVCACKCTNEAQAQKLPCLCPAYGLIDQIEDWASEQLAKK